MTMDQWMVQANTIRPDLVEITIPNLLRGQCDKTLFETFADLLLSFHTIPSRLFDHCTIYTLADLINAQQTGSSDAVGEYRKTYFPHTPGIGEEIWEVLYWLYQPDVGVSRVPNVLRARFPALRFDKDGLLTHENEGIQFTKDGLLLGEYYARYSAEIGRYRLGLTDGFLAELLKAYHHAPVHKFGLAVDGDVLFDRCYYANSLTKAYMRGPRGLSLAELQDPSFPEDRKGTITEHLRVLDNEQSLTSWYPVEKLQVKWTYREDVEEGVIKVIKTIQMEELVPLDSQFFSNLDYIVNRYVHAEWDVHNVCFRHFDGAIRVYKKSDYPARIATDFKHDDRDTLQYTKLFRIDSNLDVAQWSHLTGLFFDGNELAMEYLGGEQDG